MIKSIPPDILASISHKLERVQKAPVLLKDFRSLGGGCINAGGKLATASGSFFLKWNDAKRYPEMFRKEVQGLELLRIPGAVKIPEVIAHGETEAHQYLILEYVKPGRPNSKSQHELGTSLAKLHQQNAVAYGLDHNNYIGALPQDNAMMNNWIDFFIQRRLEPQIKMAVKSRRMGSADAGKFELLYTKLSDLLPVEQPALLHGDLWGGNVLTDEMGKAVLIDPAVYYGHREAELAFTYLFGGFSAEFYDAYFGILPVAPAFDSRIDLYNLYPLLVHVNLFGGSYARQVISILNRFV